MGSALPAPRTAVSCLGCAGLVTSNNRTDPSSAPVASSLPSGLNATDSPAPCPLITVRGGATGASVLPLSDSPVPSETATARSAPPALAGRNAVALAYAGAGRGRRARSVRLAVAQSCTLLAPPTASVPPPGP